MEDNTFWFRIFLITILFFVSSIGGCQIYQAYDDSLIVDLVKQGVSPMAARCAIYGPGSSGDRSILCMEAQKK